LIFLDYFEELENIELNEEVEDIKNKDYKRELKSDKIRCEDVKNEMKEFK